MLLLWSKWNIDANRYTTLVSSSKKNKFIYLNSYSKVSVLATLISNTQSSTTGDSELICIGLLATRVCPAPTFASKEVKSLKAIAHSSEFPKPVLISQRHIA